MSKDNIPNTVERNKDGEATGITARCPCGWSSGGHFSNMGASAAKMDHQEHCIVAKKNLNASHPSLPTKIGANVDARIAKLAYALQDSENTCKMADLSEQDRDRYFERAATLLQWLMVHGADIVLS